MYRSFRPLSIWREMDRMQREMNRLFNSYSPTSVARPAPSYPAINIWTNEDSQIITAEMPGIDVNDLEIDVSADTLTLSGERNPDSGSNGRSYHRRERNYGRFSRTIQLPFIVDTNKVEAKFNDGILHITLPRAEADKPKKISIKSE
ncbi:MAG: Hsp20 family protein [candidate division Zixibacteria bacterium]|nr:Hsp20 family protein [Gammaproteobacteria bacterium]NIX59507.1 Hsp20 family protein [candidate division Zixibacteria bacterium]